MTQGEMFASSANGDRWSLERDESAGSVYVLHLANQPSGGTVSRIELADFLSLSGASPQQQALLIYLGTLVPSSSGRHNPLLSAAVEPLRQADQGDVERALEGARVSLPLTTTYEALELFHCILDVMTDQRGKDDETDEARIVPGFGSTH